MPEEFGTTTNQPISVFFSYSHKDEPLMKELDNHLSTLKRNSAIVEWHDRKITPGEEWEQQIADRMKEARIILLLVSSDFLASDYCYKNEMAYAMERHERGEAVVIPIMLRPCRWKGVPFEKLRPLPKDAKPVTSWANQDEAFTNIAEGIRETVKRLPENLAQPAVTPKLRLPNLEQFGADRLRQDVQEIKVANPYLLGDKFVGREKELGDLTDWLVAPENGILCICDLGGTGKSALVWHWLESQPTKEALRERGIEKFWCSFYARNFDARTFLRKLAKELGDTMIIEHNAESAQRELQQVILEKLRKEKWLLVLDGLEREMGAFANSEHYQKDSEEQDRRNEKEEVWPMEREIRNPVFAEFLRGLLATPAKVLVTSRLFPEDLRTLGGQPLPGVLPYEFNRMSPEDAVKVWNRCGEPDDSPFQQEFFQHVGFHPQVISVVAAAAKRRSQPLHEWFSDFSETERQPCLDADALFTQRRHRWLELAVRDLIQHRPDAWLTLCYIVRRSEASNVYTLMDKLVDTAPASEAKPGRFRSDVKLRNELNYLVEQRLIGVGVSYEEETDGEEMADVHPVIRGLVMDYILKTYVQGGEAGKYLVSHLEAAGELRELRLRLLDRLALEDGVESLKKLDKDADQQQDQLNVLGMFYPKARPGGRPWLDGLPELSLRKDQAYLLHRTGSELMRQGLWKESTTVFNRAMLAYRLCNDLKSIEDCRRSHNWQALYNGALWETERERLDELQKSGGKSTPYWLALLLAIRQSEHAAGLLESLLPAATNRWTLQTAAEAWFYLEDYPKAAALAQQAIDRREKEKDSVGQWLWEDVTLGLALVRLDRYAEAERYLNEAKSRGTGWAYNLVPMFALAGFIELRYWEAMEINPGRAQFDALKKPDFFFKQYRKSDPHDSFQIPAAEAHLAMARTHLARQEPDEAHALAHRALTIARGKNPPFYYGSVVKRATQFLTEELQAPPPAIEESDGEVLDHEARLREWLEIGKQAGQ